ncbi:MAG: alcohol dehydrogenase catalytic domain-containing protein [Sulfolobales archaeon]
MKAAVVKRGGGLGVIDVEIPKPGEGEIVVKMAACGICGTDLEKIKSGTETPPILGHEVVGIVEEIGRGVKDLQPGLRVFVHHHISCGKCWYCYTGSETMCPLFKETNIYPGGFSEYFLVPRINVERGSVHILPERISWIRGTFIEPLATVIRGLSKSTYKPGYSAAVIGSGPMGLLFIMLLRSMGASEITAIDLSKTRCSAATALGADSCVHPESIDDLRKHDIAILSTGNPKAIQNAFRLVRRGGEILLFGAPPPGASAELPISRIFYDEVRITPSYSASERDVETSIRILSSDKIPAERIVSHIFELERVEDAFKTALDVEKALKVIVVSHRGYVDPSLRDRIQ